MSVFLSLLIFICGGFITSIWAADMPPMPGNRYDIGSHRLHINCMGEGKPTVIIDTGLGDDSSDWQDILQLSAAITRTCIYDRSGYGWSDYGPRPRSSKRIAYELGLLLDQAEILPPYILVGHSFGGFNLRLFAAARPDEIAGLILVESSHELQYEQLNIKLPPPHKSRRNIVIVAKQGKNTSDNTKPQVLRDHAYRTASEEISALYQSSRQVQLYGNIPTVPLIVISRGKAEWSGSANAEHREKIWIKLQQDLTRLSPISQHIFANHSGHDIPQQQPQIIVEAISDITLLARTMSSP
ncbi:MAG: alpha/beta hydrolase [Gammaproteobacteria bacterium]|nr:MAG: alpha/beta hydrolase [Gammaproteobacteria bacterium]